MGPLPSGEYIARIVAGELPSTKIAAYRERVKARPSFARVLKEAEPYFGMVPKA